jgi:hypothetical protein
MPTHDVFFSSNTQGSYVSFILRRKGDKNPEKYKFKEGTVL